MEAVLLRKVAPLPMEENLCLSTNTTVGATGSPAKQRSLCCGNYVLWDVWCSGNADVLYGPRDVSVMSTT